VPGKMVQGHHGAATVSGKSVRINATGCFGTWEGVGDRRSASQETRLTDVSYSPFELKGGGNEKGAQWKTRALLVCLVK
jgi:hypothetical protein